MPTIALNTAQPLHAPRITNSYGAVARLDEHGPVPAEDDNRGPGVVLHISPRGLQQAQSAQKNDEIDDSDLPDPVKKLLKMIRELQAQLQEKTQELQKLMAKTHLSEEERSQQAQQLQAQVSSLSSALATAMGQLMKLLKEAELTHTQTTK